MPPEATTGSHLMDEPDRGMCDMRTARRAQAWETEADPGCRVRSEAGRLPSGLEARPTYEEEQLIPPLDPAGATP